jgi:hypothetical protein
MKFFQEHIIFRFLWVVLALHILNFSVDTPDLQIDHVSEDLSYNDMESVIEIFLEQVLDIDNAIAEHDEQDNDDGKINLNTGIDFFIQNFAMTLADINCYLLNNHSQYTENFYQQFASELNSPPPEA